MNGRVDGHRVMACDRAANLSKMRGAACPSYADRPTPHLQLDNVFEAIEMNRRTGSMMSPETPLEDFSALDDWAPFVPSWQPYQPPQQHAPRDPHWAQ
jgi:hypothetical protein